MDLKSKLLIDIHTLYLRSLDTPEPSEVHLIVRFALQYPRLLLIVIAGRSVTIQHRAPPKCRVALKLGRRPAIFENNSMTRINVNSHSNYRVIELGGGTSSHPVRHRSVGEPKFHVSLS